MSGKIVRMLHFSTRCCRCCGTVRCHSSSRCCLSSRCQKFLYLSSQCSSSLFFSSIVPQIFPEVASSPLHQRCCQSVRCQERVIPARSTILQTFHAISFSPVPAYPASTRWKHLQLPCLPSRPLAFAQPLFCKCCYKADKTLRYTSVPEHFLQSACSGKGFA